MDLTFESMPRALHLDDSVSSVGARACSAEPSVLN